MGLHQLSKPRLKFLRQMLYGIQITKSVILSKIAAEIDEDIKQVKIEMRLCHHLAFKDLWKHLHEAVMEHAKKFVRKSMLIIIDPSDVQKRYLMYKGVRTNTLLLSAMCRTPHSSVVAFNANGSKEDVWRVVQGYLTRECAELSAGC